MLNMGVSESMAAKEGVPQRSPCRKKSRKVIDSIRQGINGGPSSRFLLIVFFLYISRDDKEHQSRRSDVPAAGAPGLPVYNISSSRINS
jgi:hypothetical protein